MRKNIRWKKLSMRLFIFSLLFLIVSTSCFPSIITALELNTEQNQINNSHVFYSCKKSPPYLVEISDIGNSVKGQTVDYIIITPQ